MGELTEREVLEIAAYCRQDVSDLPPDEQSGFTATIRGEMAYLAGAGVPEVPPEGTAGRDLYLAVLKPMVLDAWDRRNAMEQGAAPVDNPVFRRKLNQLKMTYGV